MQGAEEVQTSVALAAAERGAEWMREITAQTPWWVVSVVLHVLLITLAGLATMVVALPEDGVVVQVESRLIQPSEVKMEQPRADSQLQGEREIAPTDKNSMVLATFEISPEMRALAKLGNYLETINPNLPDMKSAYGPEEAHLFYKVSGDLDDPGGGGLEGISLDDVLGASGVSSPGKGGGWGGGEGEGLGLDFGSHHGSHGFGPRGGRELIIPRLGGSTTRPHLFPGETPQIHHDRDHALRWLAYHQEPDGHWDAVKYGPAQKVDTAMTGLALLAFVGAGHTEKVGEYQDNVRRAVAWLRSKEAPEGLIFDGTDAGGHRGIGYPTAIATLALVEAAGMSNDPATHEAAQRAVNYCCNIHQAGANGGERMGWRYQANMEGDMSVSGWFIMALKSASVAHLNVNHKAMEGAIRFLDTVEHKGESNDPGYAPPSVYYYRANDPHEGSQYRLTAIGCLCRQFLGWKKDELQSTVEGFVSKGGVPSGHVDLYYWYYGSLCTFQQGGPVWDKWNEAMKTALDSTQRHDGDEDGSWDPRGDFSEEWGRVGQTALSCMCLEVYYRYWRMIDNGGR